jgi:transcriptional regulator with XRE-family HTH domain
MNNLGSKISLKRKAIGLTQAELAERMNVTRQTVNRWEAGTVLPDIEKIADIANILGTSCDYLLKDDATEEAIPVREPGRIIKDLVGKNVKLSFFDGEADIDTAAKVCHVKELQGNWIKIAVETKKGTIEKLIPMSTVSAISIVSEEA